MPYYKNIHPLKLEVYINSENLWNLNFWFSAAESDPPSLSCIYVTTFVFGTTCGRFAWPIQWPWLIGVWCLSPPPTSIWKSSTQVWNMFVQATVVTIYFLWSITFVVNMKCFVLKFCVVLDDVILKQIYLKTLVQISERNTFLLFFRHSVYVRKIVMNSWRHKLYPTGSHSQTNLLSWWFYLQFLEFNLLNAFVSNI